MSSFDLTQRIMGLETEYGLALEDSGSGGTKGGPSGAVHLASLLVAAYKRAYPDFAPWDYGSEDPLQDARGFRVHTASGQALTNSAPKVASAARREGPGAALLVNGARLYVDHAHPEYATPEVAGPADAALWDKAGELVMARAAASVAEQDGVSLAPYKNNTDGKGASYGMHENYLVSRSVPWPRLVAAITPFLITRTVFTGSGRVGLGPRTEAAGFQLSQRADFIEAEVGLETTLNRPIVNTRDEPHADPRLWRRLHVIVGDATMMDVATYLRVGTMALVLHALEAGALGDQFCRKVQLAQPVLAFRAVSGDLSLRGSLELADGGTASSLDIQRTYLSAVREAMPNGEVWLDVLERWGAVLGALEADPMTAAGQVEWVAKYRLLEAMRWRQSTTWADPKLRAADLRWTDIRPGKSLFARVTQAQAVETLFSPEQVEWAAAHPPANTRAWVKAQAVRSLGDGVIAAGWDSLTVNSPNGTRRIALTNPFDTSSLEDLADI